MRVLVTGAAGKVGRAAVPALLAAGHDVTATDRREPDWDQPGSVPPYVTADLTDAGQVYALVGGAFVHGPSFGPFQAVVHAGALPGPGRHAPHVVFGNNLMSTFNVVEACVRSGVRRLVNISSESVAGFVYAERPVFPDYLPIDEEHPTQPQDPYALAKLFAEQLCEAATLRSDLSCVSLRAAWVQDADSYVRDLGPLVNDPTWPDINGWSYLDAEDLADAICCAVECTMVGHAAVYLANADTVGGRDLHKAWRSAFPDATTVLRPVGRPDAAGIATARAERLLGWYPRRSWRDYLSADGSPRRGPESGRC